jgi:hypothetical protein
MEKVFRFAPGPNALHIKRAVSVKVPNQSDGRPLEVVAMPLPSETLPMPPAGKGIKKIVRLVIEPHVRVEKNNAAVYHFDPPLVVTMEFTAEDAQVVARGPDSKPQLSIISCWKDGNAWHWERLKTTVACSGTCETGTLTAEIKTLRPNDPLCEGEP